MFALPSPLFVSLLFLFAGHYAHAAHQTPLVAPDLGNTVLYKPELASLIESLLTEWPTAPGVAVGVLHQDGRVETRGWGISTEDGDKVDKDTLFCVASMSKAFTSASVGILMSQLNQSHSQSACSPFDWTSKVHSILPPSKWKLQSEWSTQKANLIDILSHSSGLPRHDASYAPGDSLDQLVERMRDLKMAWELREHYSYNNQMYILASYIISQCSSKSFPAFVKQNIFDPLNMSSTTYSPTLAQQSGKKTQTWSLNGRRIPYFLAEEDVELNAGAGGVISSVYDLTKWLRLLLHPQNYSEIISPSIIDIATQAHVVSAPKAAYPEMSVEGYGMGWVRGSYRGHETIRHTGSVPGSTTIITFLPNDGVGVIVLVNADYKPSIIYSITWRLVEDLLDLDGRVDWVGRWKKKQSEDIKHTIPQPYVPLSSLSKYEGTYGAAGYGAPLTLCSSTSPSPQCTSLRKSFSAVSQNITTSLFAEWSRLWSSHLLLTPFSASTTTITSSDSHKFHISFTYLYPFGYGKDTTPFIHDTVDYNGVVEFGLNDDGEVAGFGLFDGELTAEGLDRSKRGESLMERCDTWFERVVE